MTSCQCLSFILKNWFKVQLIAAWEELEKHSRQIFLGLEHMWGHFALTEVFYGMVTGNQSRKLWVYSWKRLWLWLICYPGRCIFLFQHCSSLHEMWMHDQALTFRHPWILSCLRESVLKQLPGSHRRKRGQLTGHGLWGVGCGTWRESGMGLQSLGR